MENITNDGSEFRCPDEADLKGDDQPENEELNKGTAPSSPRLDFGPMFFDEC